MEGEKIITHMKEEEEEEEEEVQKEDPLKMRSQPVRTVGDKKSEFHQ